MDNKKHHKKSKLSDFVPSRKIKPPKQCFYLGFWKFIEIATQNSILHDNQFLLTCWKFQAKIPRRRFPKSNKCPSKDKNDLQLPFSAIFCLDWAACFSNIGSLGRYIIYCFWKIIRVQKYIQVVLPIKIIVWTLFSYKCNSECGLMYYC